MLEQTLDSHLYIQIKVNFLFNNCSSLEGILKAIGFNHKMKEKPETDFGDDDFSI